MGTSEMAGNTIFAKSRTDDERGIAWVEVR